MVTHQYGGVFPWLLTNTVSGHCYGYSPVRFLAVAMATDQYGGVIAMVTHQYGGVVADHQVDGRRSGSGVDRGQASERHLLLEPLGADAAVAVPRHVLEADPCGRQHPDVVRPARLQT